VAKIGWAAMKQDIWEHPRNIAILVGVAAAIVGALSGYLGYKIGSTPPAPIVIYLPGQAPK
jgi:hypothetical protein